jgi:predicted NAD/FAD-dependent oxidoreductase
MISTDVLIIGAGVSGLLLGSHLGDRSIILEKSRGVGGRIANRRLEDQGFDHGAPYLVDDPLVRETLVEFGLDEEVQKDAHGIHLLNSMTRFPKKLIGDLNIKKSTRAEVISRSNHSWRVTCDNGEIYESKTLVITAPLPQALELLDKNNLSYETELNTIKYLKAVMALIITRDGALPDLPTSSFTHSILPMKLRNLHPSGFVMRANPEDSERLFDSSDEIILKELESNFLGSYSNKPVIEYSEVKKWRYVTPTTTLPYPFLEVQENLFLVGDAFHHPDIRGSILGALVLAEKLS